MSQLVLALDAALPGAAAGLFEDGRTIMEARIAAAPGAASGLAVLVARLFADACIAPLALDLVAVTIGPGSFTGLRAALSLAQGLAEGVGVPIAGVTTGQAIAAGLGDLAGRLLIVATWARRGRVYLEHGRVAEAHQLDALPSPQGPVAIAGDAAIAVASRLAARGADVRLTDARRVMLADVVAVALAGEGRAPLPLYVDGPEAKLPAGGLRPAPA